MSEKRCHFCSSKELTETQLLFGALHSYDCPICGRVNLEADSAKSIVGHGFTSKDKEILRICLRNAYASKGSEAFVRPLTLRDLEYMVKQYHELDALEKMDKALEVLGKSSKYIGAPQRVSLMVDFPLFHCAEPAELDSILKYLEHGAMIRALDPSSPHNELRITSKGYERLRELKRSGKDARQCFVAMWFASDMVNVYDKAIRPAIEYIENGEVEPRFYALRIDNKEHTNDINDEIISEIRRSRFMVCDLTGYRGGVYWEAGFAHGLGLEVIYTCREDWLRPVTQEGTDENGNRIRITREGIHFDLEHRNRIEWNGSALDSLRKRLTDRIRAVIV